MKTNIAHHIAQELNLKAHFVSKTIDFLNEDASTPFIARYRKDATGGLNEIEINAIKELYLVSIELDKRKQYILKNLEAQGKLSNELNEKILHAKDLITLEDLYLPYKQKRKTKASIAKENGLEGLAKMLMTQNGNDIHAMANRFVNHKVSSTKIALEGARHIIAEWVNERITAREKVRKLYSKEAIVKAKLNKKSDTELAQKYKDYFDFSEAASRIKSHRLLAILRAEKEAILKVKIEPDEDKALALLIPLFVRDNNLASEQVKIAITDAYKRLLKPSLENELRNKLKEKADKVAIDVFAENLNELLLAAPLGAKKILAIDPGFRSGCKVVCLNEKGDFLHYESIFPHPPQSKTSEAKEQLSKLIQKYNIEAIAIGNGTAGRETERLVKSLDLASKIKVFLVNEDGASIYSASKVAREEFPKEDITVRGAISIGRRLMDPLAELVKIDAKAIGVGQYQYDVNQKQLKNKLDTVVVSCVNKVGVNVNTASKYILTYVSGLGETLAQNIIDYRSENKKIQSRSELKKVARMGAKSFEQAIGFLRVNNPKNPLDNSAVHPENYSLVKQIAKDLSSSVNDLIGNEKLLSKIDKNKYLKSVGVLALNDILAELKKPNRDPRNEAELFEFDQNIKSISDIIPAMVLPGIITNVTNFGAFVDIGIKENGLVHISNLSDSYVANPSDVVKVNQKVITKVIDVDLQRKRIGLSLVL